MAEDEDDRRFALDRLLPFQQADFEGIFEAMAGLPVTIRLLDPPLHEFLPAEEDATDERMRARIRSLKESNPMLGTRGCRLGLMFPEIYEMQIRAIARAARAVEERTGAVPLVEVMHPLVAFREELRRLRALTESVWEEEAPGRRAPDRDDDRGAQGRAAGGRDRGRGGLLLLRHERPDADDAGVLARRRRGEVPDPLPRGRCARAEPVRGARRRRRRRSDADRRRARPGSEAGDQARHLRRARRRPALDRVLRGAPARLRQLLAVPRPARPPRGGPGDAGRGPARRSTPPPAGSRDPPKREWSGRPGGGSYTPGGHDPDADATRDASTGPRGSCASGGRDTPRRRRP